MAQEHRCGSCAKAWKSEQGYLDHTCSITNAKPATVEHLDATSNGRFSLQSAKAQERGAARAEKK